MHSIIEGSYCNTRATIIEVTLSLLHHHALTFSMAVSKSAVSFCRGGRGLGMSSRTSCPLVSVGRGMGGGRAGLGTWELGVAFSVWLSKDEVSETGRQEVKGHICTHIDA